MKIDFGVAHNTDIFYKILDDKKTCPNNRNLKSIARNRVRVFMVDKEKIEVVKLV